MKWFAYNAFGAAFWLAGLSLAKEAGASTGVSRWASNLPPLSLQSQILVGICLGSVGLAVLIWSNIRTPA